jgi:hypothetical protein
MRYSVQSTDGMENQKQRGALRGLFLNSSATLRSYCLLPWTVSLSHSHGFPFEDPRDVRIANPASFLAHKVLIHNKRTRSKFAKDVLYIHDTLEIFGARLEDLNRAWRTEVKPQIHPNAVKKIQRAPADLLSEMDGGGAARFRLSLGSTIRDRSRFSPEHAGDCVFRSGNRGVC